MSKLKRREKAPYRITNQNSDPRKENDPRKKLTQKEGPKANRNNLNNHGDQRNKNAKQGTRRREKARTCKNKHREITIQNRNAATGPSAISLEGAPPSYNPEP